MDLQTAQRQSKELEQQNIELSSRVSSLRDRVERSSEVLDEVGTVLQKWQSSPSCGPQQGKLTSPAANVT
jgi:hypothetical protein